ncbi:MAG: hypothetical protein ACKVP7_07445 [Hyphomicrobiaceae bacterium]
MTFPRPISPDHDDGTGFVLGPRDRVGPPLVKRGRRRVVRALAFSLVVGGGTWAWFEGHLAWVGPLIGQLTSVIEAPPLPSTGTPTQSALMPPLPVLALLEPAAWQLPNVPAIERREAVPAPRAEPEPAPSPEPLPAYAPPPASAPDPLLRRAEAAGLHPGISRTLLARLTADDFRNAEAAIGKALAETPEDGALEWPRTKSSRLAQFRVHFVPGAGERCRRYVVEIAKDGWLTTAPPMERCGVPAPLVPVRKG